MKAAIIFEKDVNESMHIINAFKQKKIETTFIDIGQIGLYIEDNVPYLSYGEHDFDFDSVFLQVKNEFTVFVEPFLSDLVERGIYCQLKPGSFYIISNRPYSYSTLNNKGINICKTQIVGDTESVEGGLKNFSFPLQIKFFSGTKKLQGFIVDSQKSLKSILKSVVEDVDAITIQEFIQGDLDQTLVIGDEVFSVKRKWIEKELSHSKKAISSKLHEQEQEIAIKATRVVGADISTVKMVNGVVINVRSLVDFDLYHKTLGINVFERLTEFYKEKMQSE